MTATKQVIGTGTAVAHMTTEAAFLTIFHYFTRASLGGRQGEGGVQTFPPEDQGRGSFAAF